MFLRMESSLPQISPSYGEVDPFQSRHTTETVGVFLIMSEEGKFAVQDVQGIVQGLRFAFDE